MGPTVNSTPPPLAQPVLVKAERILELSYMKVPEVGGVGSGLPVADVEMVWVATMGGAQFAGNVGLDLGDASPVATVAQTCAEAVDGRRARVRQSRARAARIERRGEVLERRWAGWREGSA